jgi:hypothetical protein
LSIGSGTFKLAKPLSVSRNFRPMICPLNKF